MILRRRSEEHLTRDLLVSIQEGEGPAARLAVRALSHLRDEEAGCPACREVLRPYPLEAIAERAGTPYEEAIGQALRRAGDRGEVLRRERREADELLAELSRERDLGRAEALVLASPRFATVGLAMALVDHVAALAGEAPGEARWLAVLAVCVATRLDLRTYGTRLAEDARAVVYAALADALRAVGELDAAEGALQQAEEHRRAGSGERLYQAELELVRCRLLVACGRAAEARPRAVAVGRWAARAGLEDHGFASLNVAARASRALGELERAALELGILAKLMRGRVAWPRELAARLERVAVCCDAGSFDEAAAEVARIRLLSDSSETPRWTARLALWSGVAFRGAGRVAEAEEALAAAWRDLAEHGLGLEALRAVLELLVLYQTSGRNHDLDAIADELPDLLLADGFPTWGAGILQAVLRDIWLGELHALDEARLLVNDLLALGPRATPPQPRH